MPHNPSQVHKNSVPVKHFIAMVGLPARGKTYVSKKLCRYLNWVGINTRVFNVGAYRREVTEQYRNHEFFLASNTEAMKIRRQVADLAMNDALEFLQADGDVAIYDATNITPERRLSIWRRVTQDCEFMCLFIESLCDDPNLISTNIAEVKLNGPDYVGVNAEQALADFTKRIDHYAEQYVPLSKEHEGFMSFIKIINAGDQLVINRHEGNLQSRIGYWLMNIHIVHRSIYLTRHGESEMNTVGRIGGDGGLSPRGRLYALALAQYINRQRIPGIHVWTSWLKRTIETAAGIDAPQERWKALNEIDAGVCEMMTYDQIKSSMPKEYKARQEDKLKYRYPGGESYEDVISRLEAVIMELERQQNVVVVSHQAVLRCIMCYFLEKPIEDLPYVHVPLHTLLKLTPVAYGCEVEMIPFNIDAVNTHVPRGEDARIETVSTVESVKRSSLTVEKDDLLIVSPRKADSVVGHAVNNDEFGNNGDDGKNEEDKVVVLAAATT